MDFSLARMPDSLTAALEELKACNSISEPFGMRLAPEQMLALATHHVHTLHQTGRIEFGGGVVKKLVRIFCDSPYLSQENYESTLMELEELFYQIKSESHDCLSDDELIEFMSTVFNGRAGGSLEYLTDTALSELCWPCHSYKNKEETQVEDHEDE